MKSHTMYLQLKLLLYYIGSIRSKCARHATISADGQGDTTTIYYTYTCIRRIIHQEQDLTPSPGRSVISATVICHWSFPTERHQSWSFNIVRGVPSARSFWEARARAHDNATTCCHYMCSVCLQCMCTYGHNDDTPPLTGRPRIVAMAVPCVFTRVSVHTYPITAV